MMQVMVGTVGSLLTILVLASLSPCASVRDYCVRVESSTVNWFPPGIRSQVGTGICIGEGCSIVLTPYHMQLAAGRAGLEVVGGRIGKVLSAPTPIGGDTSDVRVGNKLVSLDVG